MITRQILTFAECGCDSGGVDIGGDNADDNATQTLNSERDSDDGDDNTHTLMMAIVTTTATTGEGRVLFAMCVCVCVYVLGEWVCRHCAWRQH